MSTLKDRLTADMRAALKARDELTTSTLRMALAAVGTAEVAGKVKRELTDDEVLAVLTKEAKKRREAATAFGDAGRAEQSAKEIAEGDVLERYLPKQLSDEELAELVAGALAAGGFSGKAQMGQAMKAAQAAVAGRAEGAGWPPRCAASSASDVAPPAARIGRARRLLGGRRRLMRLAAAGVVVLLLVSAPWLWTKIAAYGHVYGEADAPAADVVIVLGTEVAADRRRPAERLAGRLETAAALVRDGRARVILVSGDGGGASGDEPAVMTSYLTGLGVDPRRVVGDPSGLDTYDSCARAREVYGVTRALIVTQSYHLSRAVTLCRRLGLDVDGVAARCAGCAATLLAEKAVRDYFASGKAAWDAAWRRPPAVRSPADPAVQDALRDS